MKLRITFAFAVLPLAAALNSYSAVVDAGSGPNSSTSNADAAYLAWQQRLSSSVVDDLAGLGGTGVGTNGALLTSGAGNRFQSVASPVAGGSDVLDVSTTYNSGSISGTSLISRYSGGAGSGATDFLWTLANPADAFGFFAHDLDGASLGIRFLDGTSQSFTLSTGVGNLNNSFWGVSGLTSAITSVTISTTASGSTENHFDRFATGVTIRSSVPEPSTLVMAGLGLLVAGACRRRVSA